LKTISSEVVNREIEILSKGLRTNLKFDGPSQPITIEFEPDEPIPPRYSLLIGEAIYNLRACLDYIVYELAILDSGTEHKRTQFPIYETQDKFRRRPPTRLGGVNAIHTTAIERLQPYNGVNWTKWLQAISNPDKHRHLIIAEHGGDVISTTSPNPTPASGARDVFISLPGNSGMPVSLEITVFVAFNDGLPVVDTLEKITTGVANVLAYFKAEFERE
jgi:hypothetical protein